MNPQQEVKHTPGAFSDDSSYGTTSDLSEEEKEIKTRMSDDEVENWRKYKKPHREKKGKRPPLTPQEREARKLKRDAKMKEKRDRFKAIIAESKKRKYYDEEADTKDAEKYYQKVVLDLSYKHLHSLLSKTYHHAKRRENIFPIIDRQPDYTLRCVYTGEKLEDEEGNHIVRCDEEHAFPQSYQAGCKKGTGRDMHQIFAASKHANGSRGNKPFGPGDKLLREDKLGKVFQGKVKSYIPPINVGAVCRATLYVLVCYDECASPHKFPESYLPWIIERAAKEPVSLWEKHRNAELFRLQGNRNPFIDHPEWAEMIDFTRGFQKE